MKDCFKFVASFCMAIVATLLGVGGDVLMAVGASLPDAGKSNSGANAEGSVTSNVYSETVKTPSEGVATETVGREDVPTLYDEDIDSRITKIRPMATPIDQISRYAKSMPTDSFIVRYYSVGTRPIKTTVSSAIASKQSTGSSVLLQVADPEMFTLDDTIRVVGVKGRSDGSVEYTTKYATEWAQYKTDKSISTPTETNINDFLSQYPQIPDLELCVCGRDNATNDPVVYAVNGYLNSSNQAIYLPPIPANTVVIRMGKACGELDVQTGRFANIPTPEEQYCQNFMLQIEQSTFDKIAKKEVNWSFSDIEEDGIYDMRLAQENTFLFGAKNMIKHVTKDNMATWFTGGIWYMAGNDIQVGTWDTTKKACVVTDDDLVDIAKDLFTGTGIGNKQKILFCGSNMLATLSKISSEKFKLKDTVESWNLKFKSFDTDFGEILTIHHELFDANGMSDYGFALDPEYLTKKTHVSWSRNILDLKKAGVRNTDAVVLQEVACLYLRYAKAHARLKLATSAS